MATYRGLSVRLYHGNEAEILVPGEALGNLSYSGVTSGEPEHQSRKAEGLPFNLARVNGEFCGGAPLMVILKQMAIRRMVSTLVSDYSAVKSYR